MRYGRGSQRGSDLQAVRLDPVTGVAGLNLELAFAYAHENRFLRVHVKPANLP